jgi:two-component system response regulator FixJ
MDSLSKPPLETQVATDTPVVGLIEDDERAREALSFQLCTAGFQVVSHASAETFLGAPWSDKFDCIIVDICLPKMNGLQLMAEIKQLTPFVSIVFITGHGDMSIGVEAMKNGAFDCLEKPIDDRVLLKVIGTRRGSVAIKPIRALASLGA